LERPADIDPSEAAGNWYCETGSGMGRTLNIAAAMGAYTLVDRGTWISFGNHQNLALFVEDDEDLFNPYAVIRVDPEKHAPINAKNGRRFIDWLTASAGQQAIASFRLRGRQLFHANADAGH